MTDVLDGLDVRPALDRQPALFVCTANSARSQRAAALWSEALGVPAESAGTDPAEAVHPGARAAAERAGLDLGQATLKHLDDIVQQSRSVVTVRDRAYDGFTAGHDWLYWSIPDPTQVGSPAAFDRTVAELGARIRSL